MSKYIELALKLKALMESSEPIESENAKKMLNKIMLKHDKTSTLIINN